MLSTLDEIRKPRHPYYQIMELSPEKLRAELNTWTRLDLIDWLSWNDRNGIYRDEDSLREMGDILEKEEAITIIMRQIIQPDDEEL